MAPLSTWGTSPSNPSHSTSCLGRYYDIKAIFDAKKGALSTVWRRTRPPKAQELRPRRGGVGGLVAEQVAIGLVTCTRGVYIPTAYSPTNCGALPRHS